MQLQRGTDYSLCQPGISPTIISPCEPGALANDPDGGGTLASPEALEITKQIVVCPPERCLVYGCPPSELRRHRLLSKGLLGCGIDPFAPEGTQFYVDFWVWDSGTPELNATVTRMVMISKPCTDASAPYFCQELAGDGWFCSGLPCNEVAKYAVQQTGASLQIVLLPSSSMVYVRYGEAAAFYLGPCGSLDQNSSCGAVAYEGATAQIEASGGEVLMDRTGDIVVLDVTPCSRRKVRGSQWGCSSFYSSTHFALSNFRPQVTSMILLESYWVQLATELRLLA